MKTKAEKAAYQRAYYARHKRRILDSRKAYEKANKPKIRARQKAWVAVNREKLRPRHRESQRQWVAAQRQFIDQFKDVPCMDCGGRFLPCVMDFDHVRGTKRRQVSDLLSGYSKEEVLAEIAKCDVVCANCHRVRTWLRNLERRWSDL